VEAIGNRLSEWTVYIHEGPNSPAYSIHINGPNGFEWKRVFLGIEEQDAEGRFIRAAVEEALGLMTSVRFQHNILARPAMRDSLEAALTAAIGDAPGEWLISVHEGGTPADWLIAVVGPDNFSWERTFESPKETTSEIVAEAVREAVANRSEDA
jgi:hypothetical protein